MRLTIRDYITQVQQIYEINSHDGIVGICSSLLMAVSLM